MRRLRVATVLAALTLTISCEDSTGPTIPDIPLSAIQVPAQVSLSAVVLPDSDGVGAVWLAFTNGGTATDTIIYGPCAFAAVLYPAGTGDPGWQSASAARGCPDVAFLLPLLPGATGSVLAGRLAASAGVPQPPVGRFDAAAMLNDGSGLRLVGAGTVTCSTAGCGWD